MSNPHVSSLIENLIHEHRLIEADLDLLAAAIASRQIEAAAFRDLAALNAKHYLREEAFLDLLEQHEPRLASKLKAQHAEALEVATRIEEAFDIGDHADVLYLARRFLAVPQHNIIEEERGISARRPLLNRATG